MDSITLKMMSDYGHEVKRLNDICEKEEKDRTSEEQAFLDRRIELDALSEFVASALDGIEEDYKSKCGKKVSWEYKN